MPVWCKNIERTPILRHLGMVKMRYCSKALDNLAWTRNQQKAPFASYLMLRHTGDLSCKSANNHDVHKMWG